jgi:hypothetical protein
MIRAAQITALYLFDVSESIDLARLGDLLRVSAERPKLALKTAAPAYVAYQVPPVQIDGEAVGLPEIAGFRVRIKLFDYGVVSCAFTRGFSGTWDELVGVGHGLANEQSLEGRALELCRTIVDRVTPALDRRRDRFLSEDYFVFAVSELDGSPDAETLIRQSAATIAQLLRAEIEPLSPQERDEVLSQRLSYLAKDLVVPAWSSALVYDTEAGIQAALEILEYANSQLLQFRYYDDLLDARLSRIYKEIETTETYRRWWPRRYTRAARRVHALFIDVNELTDRTENALKLVGDVYAARLLALAHSRLAVTAWRDSVRDKLKTLDEIYRFAVDQTAMERGEVLEAAIVAILVFELILFFLGIMK